MGDVSGDWNPALPRADFAGRSDKDPVVASAGKVKASPGDIVTVPVRIDDLKGTEVSSFQFDVEYDPDVVAPTDNSASVVGTKTEGMVVASNVVEPGLLKVVVFGPYPVRGDGVYVDLRFNTANTAGTSSPLAIKEFRFNDGTDAVSTVDGQIDLGAAADGPVLAGRVVTPDGKAVVGAEVTVTSTAGAVATVKTDHEGRFEYEGVIVGETYTVAAGSKRLQFDPVWVSIVDRVTEIDIIAQPAEPPSAATADQF